MATDKKSSGKAVGRSENLVPFKNGEDPRRNTTGQNRKIPEIQKLLADVLGDCDEDGMTEAQKVLHRVLISAKAGNMKAAELILDRAYGKVKQGVELSGDITLNKVEFVKGGDKD